MSEENTPDKYLIEKALAWMFCIGAIAGFLGGFIIFGLLGGG